MKQLFRDLTQTSALSFGFGVYGLDDMIKRKSFSNDSDVQENDLLVKLPHILDILLVDRTLSKPSRSRNIIWANDNYINYGKSYAAIAQIKPELITGRMGGIIKPRALKTADLQKKRTKSNAEVFTPIWIVKKQNDAVDQSYKNDDLSTYVARKWLEITCGEAPYMATRYDIETGELVPLGLRQGFVDRKLAKINTHINDKADWQYLVEKAFKSSYGFEWNGDSLLLARENLLFTYFDYYLEKWQQEPPLHLLETIANIISYNIFQMDGLKYIIPLSEKVEKVAVQQLSMFEQDTEKQCLVRAGRRVKIMNWDINKMEFFDKDFK